MLLSCFKRIEERGSTSFQLRAVARHHSALPQHLPWSYDNSFGTAPLGAEYTKMASGVEDQARLLDDARNVVSQQAHQMRKCLETPGKLMDALKCRYGYGISSQNIEYLFTADNALTALHLYQNSAPAVLDPSSTTNSTCPFSMPYATCLCTFANRTQSITWQTSMN